MPLSRRVLRGFALGVVVTGVFAALAAAALVYPKSVLLVESGPVKADAVVVLGGGGKERAQRAVELFKAGEAPRVLCSGKGDCQTIRDHLVAGGVPVTVIDLEGDSRTTSENAWRSISFLRQAGAKRVIIVTSWFHSRRALHCFEHYAPDMVFYSRPAAVPPPRADGKPADGAGTIRLEYLKNVGYWFRYGVWPF